MGRPFCLKHFIFNSTWMFSYIQIWLNSKETFQKTDCTTFESQHFMTHNQAKVTNIFSFNPVQPKLYWALFRYSDCYSFYSYTTCFLTGSRRLDHVWYLLLQTQCFIGNWKHMYCRGETTCVEGACSWIPACLGVMRVNCTSQGEKEMRGEKSWVQDSGDLPTFVKQGRWDPKKGKRWDTENKKQKNHIPKYTQQGKVLGPPSAPVLDRGRWLWQ